MISIGGLKQTNPHSLFLNTEDNKRWGIKPSGLTSFACGLALPCEGQMVGRRLAW